MVLVVVTGLSGSGKTVALHALEDLGFYCIDNLPVSLLPAMASELLEKGGEMFQRTAVGINARNPGTDLESLHQLLHQLSDSGIHCQWLFLDAKSDILIQRFTETRRTHPFAAHSVPLVQAIDQERRLLAPCLDKADLHIDTTHTNVHQLRDIIRARIHAADGPGMSLLFQSFGFKHGLPRDVDFVFDVRCMPNPYWHPDLRPLTGRDPAVREFLEQEERVSRMLEDIKDFVEAWIPCFREDGRSFLTVGVGCTGGQHRSVYFAERLADWFRENGSRTTAHHRELT
jgi:UPF0042 nucleotide-binding protein